MRESFIFHAEYIDDLPDDYKPTFTMYAVNYGIYGTEPSLTGLEVALWAKIKRRIDHDIEEWENTRSNRSKAGSSHKGNQYTKKTSDTPSDNVAPVESDTMEHNGTDWNTMEQDGTNGTVNVSVNDSVNVSDSVNVAEAKPAEPAPARKRFVKPELEEIREFCFEKNINIDVDRFFNYYESKGWKVGISPMKDWKAAVRNWAKNDSLYSRPGSTRISSDTSAQVLQNYTAPEIETDVESNLAEIQGVNNAELEEDKIVF